MAHPFQSTQIPVTAPIGTDTLVPLVAGARIRVMALAVTGSTGTFNLQSSVTTANKTGTFTVGVDGLVLPYNPDGWFVTNAGEALVAVVATAALGGTLSYVTL